MSEELNAAIAWLTEHIDMREHVRCEPVHYLRKHLDAITAARARIAELEAQLADCTSQLRDTSRQLNDSISASMTSASEHAELESQLLATQRALVDMYRLVVSVDTGAQQDVAGANWYDARSGYLIAYRSAITAARAVVAQADGKEARS